MPQRSSACAQRCLEFRQAFDNLNSWSALLFLSEGVHEFFDPKFMELRSREYSLVLSNCWSAQMPGCGCSCVGECCKFGLERLLHLMTSDMKSR